MNNKYPILGKESKINEYPAEPICPLCGNQYKETGFSFLRAGAIQVDKHGNGIYNSGVKKSCYFYIGFHGSELTCTTHPPKSSDGESYFTMDVVKFLNDGDFVLTFCSIHCMRKWFNILLDDFAEQFEDKFGYNP